MPKSSRCADPVGVPYWQAPQVRSDSYDALTVDGVGARLGAPAVLRHGACAVPARVPRVFEAGIVGDALHAARARTAGGRAAAENARESSQVATLFRGCQLPHPNALRVPLLHASTEPDRCGLDVLLSDPDYDAPTSPQKRLLRGLRLALVLRCAYLLSMLGSKKDFSRAHGVPKPRQRQWSLRGLLSTPFVVESTWPMARPGDLA
ncbi:hypothetical protein C8J57DRAFT_1468165 [Mycena rebaudengoi]|nr:hypothetical protein C8J57DRAFT_1468165 [Mycena rebaudengoi]